MKCMKLGDIIQRVAEKDVNDKLNHGWKYTSKSEWKQNVRDVYKSEKKESKETEKSESKKSKKTKSKTE